MDEEFIPLTVDILKEFLNDVPDDYNVMVEALPGVNLPVMNFDVENEEFILKPGDLND